MIKRFKEYNECIKTLESKKDKSIIYFSPRLRDLISNIYMDISDDLIKLEGKETTEDITFVDIDENNNSNLTFIKWQTAKNLISNKWKSYIGDYTFDNDSVNYIFNDLLYENKMGRNSIKIGKFINKTLKGKYNSNQIEKYINEFKSISGESESKFEIVSGKEIEFWYDSSNYYPKPASSLWQSCMVDKKGIFDIYVNNPQSCRLLILKTKNNKLIGRALVWKIDNIEDQWGRHLEAEYFMDRVYSIEDYQVNKFTNFAKEKGWAFRHLNNAGYWGEIQYDGNTHSVKMSVAVKKKEYRKYPYLDTFVRYDSTKGLLHNDDMKKKKCGHILRNTTGGYERGISRTQVIINKFRDFLAND
jgi:hypothetical protein